MSPNATELLQAAMNLPQGDRAEVAELLWESVELEFEGQLSPKWQAEIQRRLAEIERGEATLLTAGEFDKRLKDRYGSLAD